MKLPDFSRDPALIALKLKMGLDADAQGSFSPEYRPKVLSSDELDQQLAREGIEVSVNEIVPYKDHTLTYQNRRVIVYIRDATFEPRFHVADCSTLQDMKGKNRFKSRYVATTREDGFFLVNSIENHRHNSQWIKLLVCQNCMDRLAFDGFSRSFPRRRKKAIISRFTIPRFFEKYPRSLLSERPSGDADSALINNYTNDWSVIAAQIKQKRGWKCQGCGRDLSDSRHHKYLHAHHKNGLKYDNSDDNLQVLCIGCHAEQPQHAQLKGAPDYREFKRRFGLHRL